MKRLLVTGSRDWLNTNLLREALADGARMLSPERDGRTVVLVHGACPTGVDWRASQMWKAWGFPVEPHPAYWHLYGKEAGPRRNRQMVNLGADLCLAFILNGSRGATHCLTVARDARIPTIAYREDRYL